jgi:hypothetical protein
MNIRSRKTDGFNISVVEQETRFNDELAASAANVYAEAVAAAAFAFTSPYQRYRCSYRPPLWCVSCCVEMNEKKKGKLKPRTQSNTSTTEYGI